MSPHKVQRSIYLAANCQYIAIKPYLINGLFDLRLLSFSTGKDEVGTKSPYELQLFPQTIRLCLDGLVLTEKNGGLTV